MKHIDIHVIDFGSEEYAQMVDLRYNILRKPLRLNFTETELAKDKYDVLIGGFVAGNLIACCILSKLNKDRYKLRQMAVSNDFQGKGIGAQIVAFAEKYVVENNAHVLELNARSVATEFYKKCDYKIVGEMFLEVGIEHYKMEKELYEKE